MNDNWYLWGFMSQKGDLIITRGRTHYEAELWASHNSGCEVIPLSFLPTNASLAYTRTHPFEWFKIPPQWVHQMRA